MTVQTYRAAFAAVLLLAVSHGISQAHVAIATPTAPAGSVYKAVFVIPHGCMTSPTISVRVNVPVGIISVKPMPKSGWNITVVRGKIRKQAKKNDPVTAVVWTGGPLPNEQFDEFTLRVKLPDAPDTVLYFPVIQTCIKGVNRWVQIPAPGQDKYDLERPAASIRLLPDAHDHTH